jgi:hypothetical protein
MDMKRLKEFSSLVQQDLKTQNVSSKEKHSYDIKFEGEN